MGDTRYVEGVHKAVWMDQFSHPSMRKTGYHLDDIKDQDVNGRLYFKTVEEAKARVRWGSAAFSIEEDRSLECVRSNYDSSG
jgi:hypothetical protein